MGCARYWRESAESAWRELLDSDWRVFRMCEGYALGRDLWEWPVGVVVGRHEEGLQSCMVSCFLSCCCCFGRWL